MFTANSMNCLTEAIGLALPGNGSTLATHAARKALFERAGELIVDIAKQYYENDDESVLPRSIASRDAFENAVALDVAMGGSTNTVLHLLAAAREAELDFSVADIDAVSRRVPCLSKVAPNSPKYHMEDVHRAGGIPALLGELDRGGALRRDVRSVHSPDLEQLAGRPGTSAAARPATRRWSSSTPRPAACAPPSRSPPRTAGPRLDTDAVEGCIRSVEHAYTADGGLAILFGNLAPDGCVVKTAGRGRGAVEVQRPGPGLREPGRRGRRHPRQAGRRRRRGGHPLRGPARRSRHAGDALPDVASSRAAAWARRAR